MSAASGTATSAPSTPQITPPAVTASFYWQSLRDFGGEPGTVVAKGTVENLGGALEGLTPDELADAVRPVAGEAHLESLAYYWLLVFTLK